MDINGQTYKEVEERADRMESYANHYLRDIAKDYKSDKESLLWWYNICGSAFSKAGIDPLRNRPVAPYIHADDIIISPEATCLEDAERITHKILLTERQLKGRMRTGLYIRTELQSGTIDSQSIQERAKHIMGINPLPSDEKNKIYTLYECMRWIDLKGFEHLSRMGRPSGRPLPYILTVDKESRKPIGLYRNWEEQDPLFERKNAITQYKLFTGFGPYGMGLAHLMLDLAKAETQMMQELVRAAELSNQPSLISASGSIRKEATQINFNPGSVNRVDTIDGNIQNAFMPLPNKEPSATLLTLKGEVSQAMMDLSTAREISPENIPANTTATTMMGILSTMHILEDSVMNRLYDSFRNELGLLFKLFGQWLPDQPYPFSVPGGQAVIMRQDFQADVVMIPIIDPNVSSQTFQLIVNETLLTLASQQPDLYDLRAIHERALRSMKVSNIDEILKPIPPPPPPPPQLDPMTENQKATKGEPIQAYKMQDHQAHKTVHEDYIKKLQDDTVNAATNGPFIAALQAHVREHDAFAWLADIEARMGQPISQGDPTQIPPEQQDQVAQQAAQAVLQKQQEAQAANPPPMDPQMVLMEEVNVKKEFNAQQSALNQQKLQLESQKVQQAYQLDQQKLALDQNHLQLDEEKIKLEQQRVSLEQQRVALEEQKVQLESQKEQASLSLEKEKSDLQVQSKAFDSTLRFEAAKDKEVNQEGPDNDISHHPRT